MASAIASPLLAGSRIVAPASAPSRQGARRGRISIQANYDLYMSKHSRARDAFQRAAEYLQQKRQGKLDESPPDTDYTAEEENLEGYDSYEFKPEEELQEDEKQEATKEGKSGNTPEEGPTRKMKVKIISKDGVFVRETERPKNWMFML